MDIPKFKNFTAAEVQQYSEQMANDTKKAIEKGAPSDIPVEKILARVLMISMVVPPTRTSVIGVLGFSAMHAPIVGVSKEALIQMIEDVYEAVKSNPLTEEASEKYAEANLKAHMEAALKEDQGGLKGLDHVLTPGTIKVH